MQQIFVSPYQKLFFLSFFLFDFSATKVVGKVMTPSALFSTKKKKKTIFLSVLWNSVRWQVWECQAWGVKGFEVSFFFNFSFFLVQNKNILLFFATFFLQIFFMALPTSKPDSLLNLVGTRERKKKLKKHFFYSLLFTFLTSFSLLVASYSIKSFLLVFFVFFSLPPRKNANIDICPKALKLVNIKLEIYGKNFQDLLPKFLRFFLL